MKKFLALFLVLIMGGTTFLTACGGGASTCTAHVDADKDGKCDSCQATIEEQTTAVPSCTSHRDANDDGKCDMCQKAFDDGIEVAPETTVECTLTVASDKGETLGGIAFTLKSAKKEYALTSGADGSVKAELATGTYSVIIAEGVLPEGFLLMSSTVEIKADAAAVAIDVVDNNPDGSPAKPFFVTDEAIAISIEAGTELHYSYRGAAVRILTIAHAGLEIVYRGNTVSTVDGVVSLTIVPEMGAMQAFVVKNTTGEKIETTMTLASPLGSMENPITFVGSSVSASVPVGDAVYYAWTADRNGVLLVSSENPLNNISLTNTATYAVSESTFGGAGAYIAVSAGEVVQIAIGSTDEENAVVIDVALHCYAGTADDPIDVVTETVDLSMAQGGVLTFSAEEGKTVTIADEAVSVSANGQTYTPANGVVTFTVGEDGLFTVTNTQDGINGVTVEVK